MPHLTRCLLLITVFLPCWGASPARAQRGELIEGLFRTIAEAQLQRERAKQAERARAEAAARASEAAPNDPYQVQLPSGFDQRPSGNRPSSGGRPFPNQNPSLGGRDPLPPVAEPNLFPAGGVRGRSGSINVRSREAAEFAGNLVKFNSGLDRLVSELRTQSSQQHRLRTILPEAYAVGADGQTLIRRCDGLSSISTIVDPYRHLDARWRQVSFDLRSAGSLNDSTRNLIRECDQICSAMARQMQIQPQVNRHALHDLMIEAASYMQVLLDDLEITSISSRDCERLTHDCRLLRQRLLSEADDVDRSTYEDVVTRFTEFARQWSSFSARVYALNDPHCNRRLDRISQCGDRTYAMLWMPPPTSDAQLTMLAHRLEQSFAAMQDQLTLRSLSSLRRDEQLRVMEASRSLYDQARQLERASEKGAPLSERQALLAGILRGWDSLRDILIRLGSINRGTLSEIDRLCEQLQSSFGVGGDFVAPIDIHSLLQAAASLEGAAEYLDADLKRYERYLQPDSYRRSLMAGSQEFYLHAKQLHALLSQPGAGHRPESIAKLQREAEHMLDGWEQLSRELSHLDGHGLSSSRAARILRSQQELVPSVATVAAALLER